MVELAPGPIGTVPFIPEMLASSGLKEGVMSPLVQFLAPVGELALFLVGTMPLEGIVFADLSFILTVVGRSLGKALLGSERLGCLVSV